MPRPNQAKDAAYKKVWADKKRHPCADCGTEIYYRAERCLKCAAKRRKVRSGEESPHWQGGKATINGYMMVLCPDHPMAKNGGYVLEHRLVMEAHLGRTLLSTEVVHHINGNKKDNRIENLMLYSSNAEHMRDHWRKGNGGGNE